MFLLITGTLSLFLILGYGFLCRFVVNTWKRKDYQLPEEVNVWPSVSLIIVCRNEAVNLPGLLQFLATPGYPADKLEVLLVDDHSEDAGPELMKQFRDCNKHLNIKVIQPEASGKKQCLNTAAELASGTWILCTDGDCRPESGWIRSMIARAITAEAVMVLGPVRLEGRPGFLQRFQQMELSALISLTAAFAFGKKAIMGNGANLLFKRTAFFEVSMAPASARHASGDDVYLVQAVKALYGGNAITFNTDPQAVVSTNPMDTLRELFWQKVRWISKTGPASSMVSMAIAILILLVNLMTVLLMILSVLRPLVLWVLLPYLVLKTLCDRLMIRPVCHITRQKIPLRSQITAGLLYPFYLLVIAVLAARGSYYWKGRRLK